MLRELRGATNTILFLQLSFVAKLYPILFFGFFGHV